MKEAAIKLEKSYFEADTQNYTRGSMAACTQEYQWSIFFFIRNKGKKLYILCMSRSHGVYSRHRNPHTELCF